MFNQDKPELRVFTLADWAGTPPDSKLYISGGAVDTTWVPELPGPLGPLFLAVRIRVPWQLTSQELKLTIQALDGDRKPVGADPIAGGTFEVGRSPGARPGDELGVNTVIPLAGMRVETTADTIIYFHVAVEDEELGVLPLKVRIRPR